MARQLTAFLSSHFQLILPFILYTCFRDYYPLCQAENFKFSSSREPCRFTAPISPNVGFGEVIQQFCLQFWVSFVTFQFSGTRIQIKTVTRVQVLIAINRQISPEENKFNT